jgi:hypothetical protein
VGFYFLLMKQREFNKRSTKLALVIAFVVWWEDFCAVASVAAKCLKEWREDCGGNCIQRYEAMTSSGLQRDKFSNLNKY